MNLLKVNYHCYQQNSASSFNPFDPLPYSLEKYKNPSIAMVEMINGIARPAEYAARSEAPISTDELEAARMKIPARMGSMQWVQPAPIVMSTMSEPACLGFCDISSLNCLSNLGIRSKPSILRPNRMMITIPPILAIQRLLNR